MLLGLGEQVVTPSLTSRPFDRRERIRHGFRGTSDTIKLMWREAIQGSRDPIVRLMAVEILCGVKGRDHENIAKRFFYWMQNRGEGERSGIKFFNDGHMTEQVRAPWWLLCVEGGGDCNSGFSTTMAALLLSVGIPCFFRTVAVDPSRPNSFSHVYTVAKIRGKNLALDASVPFSSPGSEPTHVTRYQDWPMEFFVEDDSGGGLSGWLRRLFA